MVNRFFRKARLFSEKFIEKIQFRMAVKTGVAAALALFIDIGITQVLDKPDTMISGLWSVVSAIVVVQAYLGGTYQAAAVRFLGTFIGTLFAGIAVMLLGSNAGSLALSIFFTVMVCSAMGLKESVRIASMTVAVIMILWGMNPGIGPWAFGFYRFIDSCVGIGVAVVVVHTFWPTKATRMVRLRMVETLKMLIPLLIGSTQSGSSLPLTLKKDILETFDQIRNYLEESRVEMLTHTSIDDWFSLLSHLERSYETIEEIEEINVKRLRQTFDLSFGHEVDLCIDALADSMKSIADALEKRTTVELTIDAALEKLHESLVDLREARVTRQYSIQDVESFFVFFYCIRSLSTELKSIAERQNKIYIKLTA